MQIQGSPVPHGVRPAAAQPRAPKAQESNGPDNGPECTKQNTPLGRAFFSLVSEGVYENKSGTAQIKFGNDGSVTVSSELHGEFTGRIEGDTLIAQNESGDVFTAKLAGDPKSGHFVVHDVKHANPKLALGKLLGDLGGDEAKVLDTLA